MNVSVLDAGWGQPIRMLGFCQRNRICPSLLSRSQDGNLHRLELSEPHESECDPASHSDSSLPLNVIWPTVRWSHSPSPPRDPSDHHISPTDTPITRATTMSPPSLHPRQRGYTNPSSNPLISLDVQSFTTSSRRRRRGNSRNTTWYLIRRPWRLSMGSRVGLYFARTYRYRRHGRGAV